jgi:hypothetical protein
MNWLVDLLILVALAAGLVVFVVALLSPLEALGWWAGWSRQELEPDEPIAGLAGPDQPAIPAADYYVVYLTGIGGFSGQFLGRREVGFLERLRARLPGAVIVSDVFPFSVTNNPLNGNRILARLWQWIQTRRLKNPHNVLKNLISIRNILQVAVSADPRYGPIYNVGVAREIVRSLARRGYPAGSGQPITLIGVSGGGQIALGAARYLNLALHAPIRIISVAGVLSDDRGINYVEHVYHLNGSRDRVPRLGAILYPGRWPIFRRSSWNLAQAEGRITVIPTGPMTHMGPEEYFSRSAFLPSGQSYADHTADIVAHLIADSPHQVQPVPRQSGETTDLPNA